MSQVVATMKIFPKDVTKDFSKIKESIKQSLPKDAYVYKFEEEPIAFGFIALIAHIVLPESSEGELERIEENFKKINEIDEVEVTLVRRI